jgi:hypothetical protein
VNDEELKPFRPEIAVMMMQKTAEIPSIQRKSTLKKVCEYTAGIQTGLRI